MAHETALFDYTAEAGGDLSSDQFKFMVVAADGQVDLAGDGVVTDGVLQNEPSAAGRAASLRLLGVSKVHCGAAVTRGDLIASDATGRAVTAASGDYIQGRARETSAAAAEIITATLFQAGRVA